MHVDVWLWLWCAAYDDKERELFSTTFNNYMDVGIAARVALKFHQLREGHPNLFQTRFGNKLIYAQVGFQDVFIDKLVDLRSVKIMCDGEEVIFPEAHLEGIILVNIPFFAGGVPMWRTTQSPTDHGPPGPEHLIGTVGGPLSLSRAHQCVCVDKWMQEWAAGLCRGHRGLRRLAVASMAAWRTRSMAAVPTSWAARGRRPSPMRPGRHSRAGRVRLTERWTDTRMGGADTCVCVCVCVYVCVQMSVVCT